ncbi:MAG TPA: permease-like cell division protein FtsX [Candidatus Paceibacterota bacterium]
MLWLNIRRVVRTGLLQVTRNGFVSFAAAAVMAVALSVIAGVAVFGGMLRVALDDIKDKVDVNVYLSTLATDDDVSALEEALTSLPEVASVTLLSADERLARFKENNAHDQSTLDVLEELDSNPLGAALMVKAKEPSQYAGVATFIQQNYPPGAVGSIVTDVNYYRNREAIDNLTQVIGAADQLGFGIAIALILVAILVTLNTLRLAIFTSRDEISIMKLVGADSAYIGGPFLVAGAAYGLVAAAATLLLLLPVAYWLNPVTERFFRVTSSFDYLISHLGGTALLLIGSGVLVGAVSSLIAVHRYVRGK